MPSSTMRLHGAHQRASKTVKSNDGVGLGGAEEQRVDDAHGRAVVLEEP